MKKSLSMIRGIITGASAILLVWLIRRISQEEQETQGSASRWGREAPPARTRERPIAPKRVESESEEERQPVVTGYDRPDAEAPDETPVEEAPAIQEIPSRTAKLQTAPQVAPQETPFTEMTAEEMNQASLDQPLAEPRGSDDLTRIEGIGPKISSIFQEEGINGFEQLANTPVERLRKILDKNGLQFSNPESWPDQARLAAAEDWQGLTDLQESLRGGRREG